ncbi:MAG: oligosaccharide flippase family protein [Parvularculaceae bacterium]
MTPHPARKSLKKRAFKGGFVALAGFGAAQGIRLASNLVMTRLLAPDAFGLMGITLAIQIWLNMMSDLGLDASIIRSKHGEDPKFLATARSLQLARNTLIASVLVIAAVALGPLQSAGAVKEGSVYADPRLPTFIACAALGVFINGFNAMRIALHNRHLNLVPVIRLELSSQIISIAAMVAGAMNGLGVYSLALGAVVSAIAKCVGSFWLLSGPPARFEFHREYFDEIFHYGKWLLIASTFGYLASRGDQLIFGWLFPIESFAFYSIATIWIVACRTIIETIQRRVTYPVFSELHRERPHDLTRVYRQMRFAYEAGCLVLFTGVYLTADFVIQILYTDAYHDVSRYMKLLAVMLLLMPYRLLSSIVLTSGDSRRFTIVTVVPGFVLFTVTPVVFHVYGETAAVVFAALTGALSIPFNWAYARKFVKIDYLRESVMAVVALVVAALIVFA